MGVKGLTTYIYHKESLYFEDVILKDCTVIVDGNSLAPHLYNSGLRHTSAFGGDYDRLGEITERFFKRLISNNVYPIVVFDGAVERRKVNTIKKRSKNKMISLQSVTPSNYNSQTFPMLMRKTMRGKLTEMGIVVLQSDLEADSEIAALAKLYRAPVLSNDSDYFIFNVLYIPIPTLIPDRRTHSVIHCKMFQADRFLQHLNLDRTKLILLAVILGNDYIQRGEFASFLGQIKLDRSRPGGYTQKVIAGVIRWLKAESVESALQKILSCMKLRSRHSLGQKIRKIMRGYTNMTTVLQNYIPNDPKIKPFGQQLNCQKLNCEPIEDILNNLNLDSEDGLVLESDDEKQVEKAQEDEEKESSSESISYCSSEVEDDECDRVDAADVEQILKAGQEMECGVSRSPSWLLNRSRRGLVNPDILTILNLKSYFSTPQPEFYEMSYSGEPYTQLLQFVAGLLLGDDEIQYWHRQHRNKYERRTIETMSLTLPYGPFPPIEQIGELNLEERRAIFNEITKVDASNFIQLPEDWKLYFISVMYWLQNDVNNEIKPYHLHAVVMMMVTLLVIDKRIGFHRQRKTFIKQYGAAISKISKRPPARPSVGNNLTEALKKVTREDCILSFDALLPNFTVDNNTIYSKTFSGALVHTFARLQCCLGLTTLLNDTLSRPYTDIVMHNFYNGTFLYNVAGNFKKRSNVLSYVESLFMKTPSLLAIYKIILETYQQCFPVSVQRKPKRKSGKTRKAPPLLSDESKNSLKFDSDSEPYFDKNNRFSLLI